jgi:hypothetical protein
MMAGYAPLHPPYSLSTHLFTARRTA